MKSKKETNDRPVTIRITPSQFETVSDLADKNRTTVSALIGGFVDSCVEVIFAEADEPKMPRLLATYRVSHNYDKQKDKPRLT